jgi:hypothetical protein
MDLRGTIRTTLGNRRGADALADELATAVLAWLRDGGLVGNMQIAEMAGVTRAAVSMWIRRDPDFPAPAVSHGPRHLWLRSDIEIYLDQYRVVGAGTSFPWLTPQVRDQIVADTETMGQRLAAARYGITLSTLRAVVRDGKAEG